MAGGAYDFAMGIMLDQNGKPMSGKNSLENSGFNGSFGCPDCDGDTSGLIELTNGYNLPEKKYYDTYTYSTVDEQFQRRILGDATGEMGPFNSKTNLTQTRQISSWYDDYIWFVYFGLPWFIRGDIFYTGSGAGIFSLNNTYGTNGNSISFRLVLTP